MLRGKRIPPAVEEGIAEGIAAGLSYQDMQKKHRVCAQTVYQALKRQAHRTDITLPRWPRKEERP